MRTAKAENDQAQDVRWSQIKPETRLCNVTCEVSKFQLVICNKGWFSQAVVSVQRPSFQILSCNLKGAGHSVPLFNAQKC